MDYNKLDHARRRMARAIVNDALATDEYRVYRGAAVLVAAVALKPSMPNTIAQTMKPFQGG